MRRKLPQYLQYRAGRYNARMAVPEELRGAIGTRELTFALGPDLRRAKDLLPAVVAQMKTRLAKARSDQVDCKVAEPHPLNYLSSDELLSLHYRERLDQDQRLRSLSQAWARIAIDDSYINVLKNAKAGALSYQQLVQLLSEPLASFHHRGLLDLSDPSSVGRDFLRRLAAVELSVLSVVSRRDEGDLGDELFDVDRSADTLSPPANTPTTPAEPVSLRRLLDGHLSALEKHGQGHAARRRWAPVIEQLIDFLVSLRGLKTSQCSQADDARRLTRTEVQQWRDHLLETRAPKTVKDVYLAAVKLVLARAVEDDLLPENVAAPVKVRLPREIRTRGKGYTEAEALEIIRACLSYEPPIVTNPAHIESSHISAAKRWGPLLCAFTGSRVSEMMQLRKEDVRCDKGIHFLMLTSEAGSIKTGEYREVPLHNQLIDWGFLDFVAAADDGPLFHSKSRRDPNVKTRPAETSADRVAKWLHKLGLVPEKVQPNYGWRHRFKTIALELGIELRVIDAIQGHSARTAGERYGDVTLLAKKRVVDMLPPFEIMEGTSDAIVGEVLVHASRTKQDA